MVRILFTEEELKRKENRLDKRLARGFKKMGKAGVDYAKKEIKKQQIISQEEKKVYNESFRKERLRQIRKKARQDARPKKRKKNRRGIFEMPF